MLRKTALLSTLLLCACEIGASPAPSIVSIEPEEVVSGEAATITVRLDAPPLARVDYGNKTATLLTPTLRIGDQEARIERMEHDGSLVATLPATLSAGHQDVRLELGDGHEAVGAVGLTVLPPPPALTPRSGPGGGTDGTGGTEGTGDEGRRLLVTGLRMDPIPDQIRGVPFVVTLRAEGPEATLFAGQVQLTANKGRLRPNLSNPFRDGVRSEQVVIDKPGANVVLTVRMGDELVAQSNPFKVSPD
ncbi:hypothetical protein [Archangium sp.]|uniref:hypothetical protein n=1 Tax=Archangium sp. TaxID=1872627 RepID=UPI002EDAA5DF